MTSSFVNIEFELLETSYENHERFICNTKIEKLADMRRRGHHNKLMSTIRNGNLRNIIQVAIKAMLGGVLTTVIGFIGTLLGTVLLFVLDLKLLWKKMVSRKSGTKIYNKKEISDAVWSAISYIYNKYGKKTKTI